MFNGSWRESTEAIIEIDIPDPNIDIEGETHAKFLLITEKLFCTSIKENV